MMHNVKRLLLIQLVLLLITSCTDLQKESTTESNEHFSSWLQKVINNEDLKAKKNTYHIFDSLNRKVGIMVLSVAKEGNLWIARDTSLLDDGSIYETAEIIYDLTAGDITSLKMDIEVQDADINIELTANARKIEGMHQVVTDTAVLSDIEVDSVYNYDVFREEIYMLLHVVQLVDGESIRFNMFFPNNLSVIEASISLEGKNSVNVPAGEFDSDIIFLDAGGLLDSRFWISDDPTRKLVKFYSPSSKLSVELIESVEI